LLLTGRSGDRIPVGARFSVPVQTSPTDHPASYTVGTGAFPGVKWSGSGADHTPPSSDEVKGIVELYPYSSFWPLWPILGWTFLLAKEVIFHKLVQITRNVHLNHSNTHTLHADVYLSLQSKIWYVLPLTHAFYFIKEMFLSPL
jgi:hypothetical protein